MTKKKKTNTNPSLSPENYFRQKVRNLPIYECKVNRGWQSDRLAQVLVSRIHTNGNISLAIYLVDLACLGVKDTFYQFNVSTEEYEELLEKFSEDMPMEDVSYELAHNIVYAGVEFAEEFGFKPHKDFNSVTRFMLEEDTDDVELIEIETGGEDGKPMYVASGFESEAREKQILAQLEKTAGAGNFTYTVVDNNDYEDDDEFTETVLAESMDTFDALTRKKMDELSEEDAQKLINATNEIYNIICNESKVYEYYDMWEKELEISLTDENTNEFIGLPNNVVVTEEQHELIGKVLSLLGDDIEDAAKEIAELEKQIGKTSFVASMELELLANNSSEKYLQKLSEYVRVYPDSSLIKIMQHSQHYKNKTEADLNEYLPDSDIIFSGRSSVTEFEMFRYLRDKLFLVAALKDIHIIEAFSTFLDDVDMNEELIHYLKGITGLMKVAVLVTHFENNK